MEQAGEEIVVRVGVAEVLPEALGEFQAGELAGLGRPVLHAREVFIDAVLFSEPLTLGVVGCQGLGLAFHDIGDIEEERRLHRFSVDPDTLHGVDVVEVGDSLKRC